MPEPMSDGRLEDLFHMAYEARNGRINGRYAGEVAYEALLEAERLRAENKRLWPWALNDFKECPDCIKCVACGGLGELCESHSAFVWDGCDCELE